MYATALIIILLGLIALSVMVVHFLIRNTLTAALGSLIAILGGLVTALVAPSAEGNANVNLQFGPFGAITANLIKVNTPTPKDVWYIAFITVGILTLAALYFVYESRKP